jgi:hypothetical protein
MIDWHNVQNRLTELFNAIGMEHNDEGYTLGDLMNQIPLARALAEREILITTDEVVNFIWGECTESVLVGWLYLFCKELPYRRNVTYTGFDKWELEIWRMQNISLDFGSSITVGIVEDFAYKVRVLYVAKRLVMNGILTTEWAWGEFDENNVWHGSQNHIDAFCGECYTDEWYKILLTKCIECIKKQ